MRKFTRTKSTDSHELSTSKKSRNSEIFHEVCPDAQSLCAFVKEFEFDEGTGLYNCKRDLAAHGYLMPAQAKLVREAMMAPPEMQTGPTLEEQYAIDGPPLTESRTIPDPEVDEAFKAASQRSEFVGSVGQEIIGDFSVTHIFDHRRGSKDKTVVVTDMADNQYVYRGNSKLCDLNIGDVVELSFYVKAHEVYHGKRNQGHPIQQTAIKNPTLLGVIEHAAVDYSQDYGTPETYTTPHKLPALTLPSYQGRDVRVTSGYQPKQFQQQPKLQPSSRRRSTRGGGRRVKYAY